MPKDNTQDIRSRMEYDRAHRKCMLKGDPDACPSFEDWQGEQKKKVQDATKKVSSSLSEHQTAMSQVNAYMRENLG